MVNANGSVRKGVSSMVMLASWEIRKVRNARAFRNMESMPGVIASRIKAESTLWGLAGPKHLRSLMSRE